MADTTSHDTVGASTLAAPYYSPSSPTPSEHPPIDSPDGLPSPVSSPGARSPSGSPPSTRQASLERAARELDARLAQYTVDFSQFPSGHADDGLDEQPEVEDETDRLSAVGGPEDFTANLERYLLGEDDSIDQDINEDDKDQERPQDGIHSELELPSPHEQQERPTTGQSQQPGVEDEAELGEYSEFGPPDDMSTPSHLLRRQTAPTRDATHLEDIEESPDDEPDLVATPTVRKPKSPSNRDVKQLDDDLRCQIVDLRQAVQERDEQLERNRGRVLEAVSAGEEIKQLRAELQRKTSLLEEIQESHAEKIMARRSSVSASDFSALQKQITDLQSDLHSRNSHADIDAERLETIALLRQQLSLTQEQLRKRDAVLDETLASLKQVTASKEQQLHEKNGEIDRLRGEVDTQRAEIDRLEADVSRVHREYRVLEDQMVLLETKNRPLEEKNSTLEADLTRVQSQVTAQENALKAMAADLPSDNPGGTYSEILELIKDLGQPNTNRPTRPRDGGDQEQDHDLEQIYQELSKLRTESSERATTNKTLETQLTRAHDQAAESQLLIQSVEAENTRLAKSTDELKASLDKALDDLTRLRIEHSEAQGTIERLQDTLRTQAQAQSQIQQPSPPSTPHANPTTPSLSTLEATHKAQITNLKTAHATALSTLRSAHADSTHKLRALLSASEAREAELRSLIEQQEEQNEKEREVEDSAKDNEIATLRAEIQRLHSVITTKDETAAAMDLRIAKSVEKREREWERRVELLLKEREKMGKALLWTWGEKENTTSTAYKGKGSGKAAAGGDENDKENTIEDGGKRRHGHGQPYRYKYAKKT
ncbi:hypothetical protein BDW74DRAFT_156475 [Aspergillus multicolor]|uniref:putative spindle pole body associated protein SnaD n=1 Tax=Aspergillus multicolor TaxID=41759 RepID=UPI003CCD900E